MALLLLCGLYIAFWLLAQAMPRHSKQIWQRALPDRQARLCQRAGFLLLTVTLLVSCGWQGIANGILCWLGLSTVAALGIALLLSYRPQWLRGPLTQPPPLGRTAK
jgi:hypothetical protein